MSESTESETKETKQRRVCEQCGVERAITRFPRKGRGRSRVCRPCVNDGKAGVEVVEGAEEPMIELNEPIEPNEPAKKIPEHIATIDPALEVGDVPTKQVQQILLMAKDMRTTARELRKYARENLPDGKVGWVDTVPARMLDTAAVQLELLCQ